MCSGRCGCEKLCSGGVVVKKCVRAGDALIKCVRGEVAESFLSMDYYPSGHHFPSPIMILSWFTLLRHSSMTSWAVLSVA